MSKKNMLVKLPAGLGNFVTLFKPRPPAKGREAENKEKVYGIIVAWPKKLGDPVVSEIQHDDAGRPKFRSVKLTDAVREVAESEWPGKGAQVVKAMTHPVLRDGDAKEAWGLAGMSYVHAKRPESFGAPPVFDRARRLVVTDAERDRLAGAGYDVSRLAPGKADEEAYSGCTVVAQVTLYPYDNPLGGKGVGVSLTGVQVTAKGPRIGGGRADEQAFEELPDEEEKPAEPKAGAKAKRNPWD